MAACPGTFRLQVMPQYDGPILYYTYCSWLAARNVHKQAADQAPGPEPHTCCRDVPTAAAIVVWSRTLISALPTACTCSAEGCLSQARRCSPLTAALTRYRRLPSMCAAFFTHGRVMQPSIQHWICPAKRSRVLSGLYRAPSLSKCIGHFQSLAIST